MGRRRTTELGRSRNGQAAHERLAPRKPLWTIQVALSKLLQTAYRAKPSVHGYVAGRNVVSNSRGHVRKRYVLTADLEDFFPTINFGRVRGLLRAWPFECTDEVASLLAKICCFRNGLPIDAPTSPIISNAICARLDTECQVLARENGCWYSRYADDLTFSTNRMGFPPALAVVEHDRDLEPGPELVRIVTENGFRINREKFRLQHSRSRQLVTGLVVNERLNVRRRYTRQIRALLNAWDKYGLEDAQHEMTRRYRKDRYPGATPRFRDVVYGKVAYLAMVRGRHDEVVGRFYEQIDNLEHNRPRLGVAPAAVAVSAGEVTPAAIVRTVRILHLSDFHFDESNDWDASYVRKRLVRILEGQLETQPDLVVMTGDIASHGKAAEYELAKRWILERLLPALRLDTSRLLIVPGNHDVDRDEVHAMAKNHQEQMLRDGEHLDELVAQMLADEGAARLMLRRLDSYRAFLQDVGHHHDDLPWWIRSIDIGPVDVRVAGLCTSWCSYQTEEYGRLLLGSPQVTQLVESSQGEGGALHVALLHHPMNWLSQFDLAAVSRLESWANIILRGHLHDERVIEYRGLGTDRIVDLGAGSCYQGSTYKNGFQLVEVDTVNRRCDITPYRWSPGPPQRWHRSGDVFLHTADGIGHYEYGH